METTSPLDQLADIHLPHGVSVWPLAPGWWLLLALCILALIVAFVLYRRHQRRAYRRDAERLLSQALVEFREHQQSATYLQQVANLLRRTAITSYGPRFDASLHGVEWLEWLDRQDPRRPDSFATGAGQVLLAGPYQPTPSVDADALHTLASHWIKHHRARPQPAVNSVATKKSHIHPEATHV